MKKLIWLVCAVALLTSCHQKTSDMTPSLPVYDVTVGVTNIDVETTGIRSGKSGLKSGIVDEGMATVTLLAYKWNNAADESAGKTFDSKHDLGDHQVITSNTNEAFLNVTNKVVKLTKGKYDLIITACVGDLQLTNIGTGPAPNWVAVAGTGPNGRGTAGFWSNTTQTANTGKGVDVGRVISAKIDIERKYCAVRWDLKFNENSAVVADFASLTLFTPLFNNYNPLTGITNLAKEANSAGYNILPTDYKTTEPNYLGQSIEMFVLPKTGIANTDLQKINYTFKGQVCDLQAHIPNYVRNTKYIIKVDLAQMLIVNVLQEDWVTEDIVLE